MPVEIIVPEAGESIVEATVSRWLKKEGDYVEVGEPVVELETDKVNLEVAAEQAGVLAEIKQGEGVDVQVGDVLGIIDESADEGQADSGGGEQATEEKKKEKREEKAESKPATEEESAEPSEEKATPVAKRMAEEHGLDLNQISTQDGGRITREDVQRAIDRQEEKPAPAKQEAKKPEKPAPSQPQQAPSTGGRPERRERMSRRRQTIAQRLVEAQQNAAMLTTFNELDMSAVMDMRKRRQENFVNRHDIKLGFMSFFVKASIGALKAFPAINAEIDETDIVYKEYYDIGMAVGAPQGLVVPVIRDADRMSFAEIEQAIKEMAQKARDNNLSLDELRGGTFTITNGGVFGSMLSTPILNPPQVGILGLHKIEQRPVVVDGEIVIRPMMYVALSYDHRIVDGREAVQFLVRVKELIEDPEVLLLEG